MTNEQAYVMKDPPGGGLYEGSVLDLYALERDRRPEVLRGVLATLRNALGASGVAMLYPSPDDRWGFEYVGEREAEMRRWLRPCLEANAAPTGATLGRGAPCAPGASPEVRQLGTSGPSAVVVLWPGGDGGLAGDAEGALQTLRLFLEVEQRERLHFRGGDMPLEEELARALRGGDPESLSALLALARMVGGADLVYWGGVHDEVVDVERSLGARGHGFGFELPLGEGVGGRAFAGGEVLSITDYRNCQYRYPGVSDVTDSEEVRSTLAVPVSGVRRETGGVLYAVRRAVEPFSPVDRALLRRLGRSIEPVPDAPHISRHFFASGEDDGVKKARAALRRLLLDSTRPREIEAWLESVVKGPAILSDPAGRPYVSANAGRLERLRRGEQSPRIVPLSDPGRPDERGILRLWPSVEVPPAGWDDLLDDAAAVAGVVLDRAEQAYDRLNRDRSRWLNGIIEGDPTPEARREGNRLGLPTDRGEVWAIAWRPGKELSKEHARLKMLAEDALLDRLGSPLISPEEGMGAILLKDSPRERPAAVRDELLRIFGPDPLWMVHGATYDSLEALKSALTLTIRTARRVRDKEVDQYISEVGDWGLDGFLENPKLSGDLDDFARNLLGPLLVHDRKTGSRLSDTLCLVLTAGPEAAAERLFVHANTVRYRMRRAEALLGRNLSSQKDRTALSLAAFIHSRRP